MEIRGDTNTGKIVTKVTNISFKKHDVERDNGCRILALIPNMM